MAAVLVNLKVMFIALWVLVTRPIRVLGTLISLHWAAGFNPFANARLIGV